ncbi:uncharacterized protein [Musca autumnalis]|uniref:uncharacterized protein n=1 Tax=Musca autumnalis TaxID=221902 RepID=UPI003CF12547
MASKELFPEVVLSDYDDAMMSDREVEEELMVTSPALPEPKVVPAVDDVPATTTSNKPDKTADMTPPQIAPPPSVAAKTVSKRVASSSVNAPVPCRLCTQLHPLTKCTVFKRMSLEKRVRAVAYHRYCYNCLRSDHLSKFCPVPQRCKYCAKKHHTYLHEDKSTNVTPTPSRAVVPRGIYAVPPPHILPTSVLPIGRVLSLSPTVLVRLCLPDSTIPVRALLDPCCPVSQVCASLITELQWPTTKVNDMTYADFLIMSRFDSGQKQFVTARVANITRGITPPMSVPTNIRESFVGLELADPAFDRSGPLAMVLGPEIYYKILSQLMITQPGLPTAQYTSFGWVIAGPVNL